MVNRHQQTEHKTTSETFRLRRLSAGIRMAIAGGVLISSVSPVLAEVPAAQVWAAMGGAAALSQAMPPLPQAFDDATAGVTDQLEGANKLNINLKDKDRAILNWKSFNVNTGKEVQFHQKDGSSIALNRIFQENPSQILGKVTANGQIYLYNQNGFVFGKDATVNTNTLVASTLNISDEAFAGGITQQNNISIDKPAFGPEDDKPETATKVDSFIQVEQGAKIHATSNGGKDGNDGLIIMAAPTIENKGSISTDQYGQIILVASEDKVYLQPTDNNSPFSGLLVEVDTGGKVSNLGEILTREGNVTLQGFAVNQGGRITATTSINENGSIRLLAQERHRNSSGKLLATQTVREADLEDGLGTESTVTFTPNSVTQIVADESGGKAIDAQAQPQSYMDIVANKVHLQGADGVNNGAAIVAPGGKVNIVATNELNIIDPVNGNVTLPQTPTVAENAGRVLIEKGATIDVSGTQNVSAEMERNVAEISVQSFELRDSPLQKTGILKGQTVRVDIRKDNQVIDTSGAVNRLERSLEERLGKGGEINITSGGDVLVNDGAVVNISGGSVDYQDGYINTTKLMDQYGQIIDISEADPNERYISIFGVVNEVHEKWGVTKIWNILEQFSQGQFERGYTEGQRAGALNIQTPLLSWNGELIAGTESGRYQRETGKTPFGGSLTLNEKDGQQSEPYYVSQQNVVFQAEKTALQLTIDDEFPRHDDNGESLDDLILSESLINGSGLQSIVVNTSGSATISKDASIAPAFGGPAPTQVDSANPSSVLPLFAGTVNKSGALFSVDATQIDVQGDVYMPGGSLELSTHFDVVANNPGEINLDKTTTIDVSGRWVNDFEKGFTADPIEPLIIDGGSVKLAATGDLSMKAGSVIKADGGAWLALNNELTEGAGGAISLTAATSNAGSSLLHLDGKLSAYGLSEGGSLTLSSGKIVVGSLADAPDDNGVTPLVLGVDNGNFQVAKNSGFGEIHLISNEDDLTISGDTDLRLLAQNRVLASDFRDQSSAQSISGFSDVETLPESLRHAVDLSLTGESGVIMETGAKITGDKESSISLLARSKGGVFVDGVIDAPGGSIELAINADPGNIIYDPAQAVWLGSQAQLLARGTTRLDQPDALGLRSGEVLDGGNVTLAANRGYVVQQQGALIDVSGTHAILDLPVAEAEDNSALGYAATDVGSNAGKINIAAGEGVILNGQMSGFAGSETTRNGSFNLTLDRNLRALDPFAVFPTNPAVIQVSQTRQNNLDETVQYGDALDNFSNDSTSVNDPDSLNGKASISSQLIAESGFEEVRLNSLDEIRFVGDVDLTAKARIDLNTAKITWQADPNSAALDGKVNIDAAFLRIGSELSRDNQNIIDLPIAGAGVLTTVSQWTELVGASRWDGFSEINLNSAHDLRTVGVRPTQGQRDFIGSMTTAANLNLNASQIYPTTLSNFTFTVNKDVNPEGQINITGSNTDASPLSANGSLAFDAPIINQGGVLKAPFGSIKLTAGASLTLGKDSLTSVSGDGKTIPFGVTLGGLAWLYPLSDSDGSLVFNSSPDFNAIQTKQLTFDSPEITLEEGSVVDISGGGDLLAYEFQTGVGGTNDYLAPINATDFGSYQGGFAILPSLGSSLAPSDHSQNAAIAKLPEALQDNFTIGGSVYLSGSESLPAGTYTILPPRYALLPGAYLVTPQANTQDLAVTTYTKDGLPIVPGYQTFAATGTRDARSSGFLIEQGADIRQHSQYDEKTANSFFTELAEKDEINIPLIPNDSGQLLIDV
ncbi:MAG: two-partner secretion domain-containing protein, partial [Methylococcaceae bacterium]